MAFSIFSFVEDIFYITKNSNVMFIINAFRYKYCIIIIHYVIILLCHYNSLLLLNICYNNLIQIPWPLHLS